MNREPPLTAAEQQALEEYRQRYLAAGLSTAPADRAAAEAAFAAVYRRLGRQPVPVVWVASPLSASVLLGGLEALGRPRTRQGEAGLWDSLGASLGTSVQANLRAAMWASLRASSATSLATSVATSLQASLGASLWASLGASLGSSLRASLAANLWADLTASLATNLAASVWASLRANLAHSVEDTLTSASVLRALYTAWWGQMDLCEVASYRFAEDMLGVQYAPDAAEGLHLLDTIGHACGWWYPRDGLIVACDRPAVLQMEEHPQRPGTYRLHASDGPAVQFRDGWAIYAWHGVRVPQVVIDAPSQITREMFLTERNVEVRRAMWERLGPDRVAALLDLEPLQTESWNGQTYTLLRTREPDAVADDRLMFVRVTCPSTGRVYHLSVPPTVQTARDAVAWTFGHTADDYHPDIET
jgi:hypothetical protein